MTAPPKMQVMVVVEDDPGMRVLIQEVLSEDPRLDLNGKPMGLPEAMELARSLNPDLLILDHFIEGDIMGLQAAPMLKEASPRSKILLFTSHDLTVEAGREPAIDRILLKKHLDQLLPTVRSLLGLDGGDVQG
jgi:DNA-binding NarL/FixJ family response regulator